MQNGLQLQSEIIFTSCYYTRPIFLHNIRKSRHVIEAVQNSFIHALILILSVISMTYYEINHQSRSVRDKVLHELSRHEILIKTRPSSILFMIMLISCSVFNSKRYGQQAQETEIFCLFQVGW